MDVQDLLHENITGENILEWLEWYALDPMTQNWYSFVLLLIEL